MKIVFMSGTSAVGKTTALNVIQAQFPEVYQSVGMAARDVRALLDNPTWESLCREPTIAEAQQICILGSYFTTILHSINNPDWQNKILIFDRCPFDVPSYSHAFLESSRWWGANAFCKEQINQCSIFFNMLVKKHDVCILHMRVDKEQPYAIEAARPPESIRAEVAKYLEHEIYNRSNGSNFKMSFHDQYHIDPSLKLFNHHPSGLSVIKILDQWNSALDKTSEMFLAS